MKKYVISISAALLALSTSAVTYMRVKTVDGNVVKYDVEQVLEVDFEEDPSVIDPEEEPSLAVYMAYNEFVADGGLLQLRGKGFEGESLEVDFQMKDGSVKTVKGSDITLLNKNLMSVKVPEGTGESFPIVIRNVATGDEAKSSFLFRDTRNLLIDFDSNLDLAYSTGAFEKGKDGSYNATDSIGWNNLEENYSVTGKRNQFGVLHDPENWEAISFSPEAGGAVYDEVRSVFGPFKELVKANPASAKDYVVKFEVNVPKDSPTNCMTLSLGFTSAGEEVADQVRSYNAFLQMSAINWSKDVPEGWMLVSSSEFYTDGWMTVTIPMSEFMWNVTNGNYIVSAHKFSEGDFSNEADQQFFGDPVNHLPYVEKYSSRLTNDDDLSDYFGGFAITFNPYDGPRNSQKTKFAIDNIRIVPNDGNGAIYPKLKYGIPSQHYYMAPRRQAFKK